MVRLLADWLVLPIAITVLISLVVFVKNHTRVFPYVIMAGLTSLVFGKFWSLIYQPSLARPFEVLSQKAGAAYMDNPGFPSDHLLLITAGVLAVAVLAHKRWLTAILVVGVSLVAVGRVLALVHTPIDIVGGVISGLFGGLWYIKLYRDYGQLWNR